MIDNTNLLIKKIIDDYYISVKNINQFNEKDVNFFILKIKENDKLLRNSDLYNYQNLNKYHSDQFIDNYLETMKLIKEYDKYSYKIYELNDNFNKISYIGNNINDYLENNVDLKNILNIRHNLIPSLEHNYRYYKKILADNQDLIVNNKKLISEYIDYCERVKKMVEENKKVLQPFSPGSSDDKYLTSEERKSRRGE